MTPIETSVPPVCEDDRIVDLGDYRGFQALLRLKRGESLAAIALGIPNRRGRGWAPTGGVSEKTVDLILRSASRVLLTGIMLDRQPDGLPDELWPPEAIRDEIRDTPAGLARRARLEGLRAWIEGRYRPGGAPAQVAASTADLD